MDILKERPVYIVSAGPSIVPTHSKRFPSFLGKADMPGEDDIINVISSLLSLFATLPATCWVELATFDLEDVRGGARGDVTCSISSNGILIWSKG